MGYTHYYAIHVWDTPEWQKAWGQLIQDVPNIIKEARVPLSGPIEDEDEITPVVVDSEKGIYLNGVGRNAHEPFILCKPGKWTFCKTARKPYDVVVTSLLLRIWMLAPKNLDLGSDGGYEDWADARDLCATLWPGEPIDAMWAQGDEENDEAKDESDQAN
ncbi:hypothetical protein PCG10_009960 [Penicillium crustosum]|uniref:Uncharacterized protein n=1 Tax=Penicillium crustosum TaxID=36656 RepID=A0A9P5GGM6_PENCR|nr:uncharacterized protein N7487_007389 [Penicillium crustosum]KAF7519554.1 hypothetical protein PCG10_009960 [Penicillium crustosum]KAJ5401493.1 hypothetical protein N7487_007389 [Penicillium crustosum]